MRIFFLTFHHDNVVSFQEINPENFMPLKSSVARSFLCQICPYSVATNSPKSSFNYFYEFMDPTAADLGKQIWVVSLWIHLYLQNMANWFICKLSSLMVAKKSVIFILGCLFLLVFSWGFIKSPQ